MADALVSVLLKQLTSIVAGELSDELKLLKGVEKEIQNLKKDFEAIKEVLDDAEMRSLRYDDVQKWVDQLKDICYDMEDVLDDWRTETALQQQHQPVNCASWLKEKVIPWISFLLPWIRRPVWNRDIALKIKDINQRLDAVVNEKDRFKFTAGTTANEPERPQTVSFFDVSEFYGRDDVKKSLIDGLLSESSQGEHNLTITAIVGMAGIGKTALAQVAYDDENVRSHFAIRIWVCVSDPFNVTNIAREIIEGLKDRPSDLVELQSMLKEISEAVKNQTFLLILDDVWNEDYYKWKPLRKCLENGARGSKILVTTRSERVAKMMGVINPIRLDKMSDRDCWSIFSKFAFSGRSKDEREHLKEIGWKIMERCKGLPLAAKVLGGLLHSKRSSFAEWEKVLDSDLWALGGANKHIDPVFMSSYYDLPSEMKRSFTYCAIFPQDHVIEKDSLIQLWMANGFLGGTEMEETGEEYIETLATQSFFRDLEKDHCRRIRSCKVHDLLRGFAGRVSGNECGAIEVYKDEEEELMMKQEQPAYAKLRHARLTFKGDQLSSALSQFRTRSLRTLLTTGLEASNAEMKMLGDLTGLRVLELKESNIKELPEEIRKLMHLRYLGLEWNEYLEALPETVCDLFNLQTLKLSNCPRIKTLPGEVEKLLNLRQLEFVDTGIEKLPKGIGELTSLRTLRGLIFYSRDDDDKEEYFGIGDLEKLDCLRDDLQLRRLGNVEVDDVGEAKRARLKKKKSLRSMSLYFDGSSSADAAEEEAEEEERAERHLSMAEAFEKPPPNLETLAFNFYEGMKLPSWIASLSELKFLHLENCPNLKELPGNLKELPRKSQE